jgi:hypothetical protein
MKVVILWADWVRAFPRNRRLAKPTVEIDVRPIL